MFMFLAPLVSAFAELSGVALYSTIGGTAVAGGLAAAIPAFKKGKEAGKKEASTELATVEARAKTADAELESLRANYEALQAESDRVLKRAQEIIHQHSQQLATATVVVPPVNPSPAAGASIPPATLPSVNTSPSTGAAHPQ